MIKYITYDSIDETGQHIIPVNSLYDMNKTASSNYSPEVMKIITSMKRRADRYYVVVNALGSYEVWGANRNGDAFPESGLCHKSLRTDMGTESDYGYKTFEYYAKFYKHHVNKDPNRSFGEIVFSYWNPILRRVELIVAIDVEKGADIVAAFESGEPVAVSMGCRVKFDRCSICDHKAPTRKLYCVHAKKYLGQIIDEALAKRWSRELNKIILPGTQVCVFNDFPRFFDLSKVFIGADRTSFGLGKAASKGIIIPSVDLADAYNVTDDMVDKFAQVNKEGEINKEVGAKSSDIDGKADKADKVTVLRKAIDERVGKAIAAEPNLPKPLMDSMASTLPLSQIFSTLLGLGIHPKPEEFQRIVLIRINEKPLADKLDQHRMIFNYKDDVEPQDIDVSNRHFSNTIGRVLTPYLNDRSCFPSFLEPRIKAIMVKTSEAKNAIPKAEYTISPGVTALAGLAALYAGLKFKAKGYGPKQLAEVFTKKPWLKALIGGGIVAQLFDKIDKSSRDPELMRPARDYENVLRDTNFSGQIKQSALNIPNTLGYGVLAGALTLPSAYIINAYNQRALYRTGRPLFPGAGSDPKRSAITAGAATAGVPIALNQMAQSVGKKLHKLK